MTSLSRVKVKSVINRCSCGRERESGSSSEEVFCFSSDRFRSACNSCMFLKNDPWSPFSCRIKSSGGHTIFEFLSVIIRSSIASQSGLDGFSLQHRYRGATICMVTFIVYRCIFREGESLDWLINKQDRLNSHSQ